MVESVLIMLSPALCDTIQYNCIDTILVNAKTAIPLSLHNCRNSATLHVVYPDILRYKHTRHSNISTNRYTATI